MKFGFAHPCYAALVADRLFGLMADVKDEAAIQAHPRPVMTRGRTVCRLVFPCYDSSFYATFKRQGIGVGGRPRTIQVRRQGCRPSVLALRPLRQTNPRRSEE